MPLRKAVRTPRTGRPPLPKKLGASVRVRLKEEDFKRLGEKAKNINMSLSAWIRMVIGLDY